MGRLQRLIALPADARRRRFEAARDTAVAALLVAVAPSRWVVGRLGDHRGESPTETGDEAAEVAGQVAEAVHSAAYHVPGKNACLVRAIVAAKMLSRRRLPWTLYLGMARSADEGLQAHAWVRCGEVVVTGGEEAERFSVVARFSGGAEAE